MEIIKKIFGYVRELQEFLKITKDGYYEHLIVGLLIACLISHVYFEKTPDKFKSIFIGISTAFFVGILKECYDFTIFGSDFSIADVFYTVLGSIIGSAIFLLKTYVQKKNV